MVDTCAAEFPANTPYFYSTYEPACEIIPTDTKKVLILGSGPIRIGQGIEFDYCTVHAVQALREEEGVEVNFAHGLAQRGEKGFGDQVGHVQAPAVGSAVQPSAVP